MEQNGNNEEGKEKDIQENNAELDKKNLEINNSLINQGTKIVIDLYIFNNHLHNSFKESISSNENPTTFLKDECYLIKEDYFSQYINYFLYKDMHKEIKKDNPELNREIVFKKLLENYQKHFNEKTFNKEEIPRLIDEKNYQVEYKLNNNNTELIFMHKYSLLNKAIIDSIFENETKSIKIKPSQIINNKKIIIKYEEKKAILIGTINEDDISNIFIPEIILVYDDIKQLENQFNFFENNDYDKFKEAFDLKEKITDLKEDDKIIGKAYLIDKNKYNNLNNYNENILSRLYNSYESINNKIKQPYEKELKMDYSNSMIY